jgi:DNA polymerase III epsilon subunit-like protein
MGKRNKKMSLNNFLVVDLEATGPNTMSAELLTGSMLYLNDKLEEIGSYSFTCRPRYWGKEADEAVAIHGISYAEAQLFTPWQEAIAGVAGWLSTLPPCHFVAHANRKIFGGFSTYDYALLSTHLFDLNFQWELYRACPRQYIISTHSLASYLNLPCERNLKALAEYLGVDAFKHHDARAETMACYQILKKLLPQVELESFFCWEYKLEEVLNENRGIKPARDTSPNKRANSASRKMAKDARRLI